MKAYFYLIFSACCWGLNFHLLKLMLTEVSFVEAGFWRYFFCIIGFLPFIRKEQLSLRSLKKALPGVLTVGIFGLFLFNIFLFWGLKYTSPINASLIISLSPVTTLFISAMVFKTPVRIHHLLGACLGFGGIIVLLTKGEVLQVAALQPNLGDGLVFLAMLLASSYHIWVQKFNGGLPLLTFTFVSNLVCFLAFSLTTFLLSQNTFTLSVKPSFWISAIAFGTIGTTIIYFGIKA